MIPTARRLLVGFVLALGVGGFQSGAEAPPAQRPGLEALFAPGGLFRDGNGDGVVDGVDAAVVVGRDPDADTVAAAANVAARFGFETSALDLPLARTPAGGKTLVLVGRAAVREAGLSLRDIGVEGLPSGQGVVTVTAVGGRQAVVVAGVDGAGTRAAAEAFAGRLPLVWEPKGVTVDSVAGDVRRVLETAGTKPSAVHASAIVAAAGADSLEHMVVDVALASRAEALAARRALIALRPSSGRRGATPASAIGRTPRRAGADTQGMGASALSYSGVRNLRIRLSAPGARPTQVDLPRLEPPRPRPLGRRPGTGAKESLDLSVLYGIDGLLGDSDGNLIPDRVDALLSPSGEATERTVDLAARLGLESTGIAVPIATPGSAIEEPEAEPTLVLIGLSHPLVARLEREQRFERPRLEPGQGVIQIVRKAFGEKPAVVITGGDAAGLARALEQTAERLPHIWARGPDRTTLDDVEEDLRKFLSGRSPAGQAATALYKIDRLLAQLPDRPLESLDVTVFVEKPAAGLDRLVRDQVAAAVRGPAVTAVVEPLDVTRAKPIIGEEITVASEVDEFWRILRSRVVPRLRRGRAVTVEARLSEPPEVRERLAREARAELVAAGAADAGTTVTVLSAYKQGFSWLYDVIRPELARLPVETLTIKFAEIGPPPEWKHQAMYAPTRWLLEIFPIDEVLSRELRLDLARIRFEKTPIGSPAYEVVATGAGGRELLRRTFEPKYVVRPYFDRFPDYEKVRVTTGWITARQGEAVLADERIVTDVERFWDYFQSRTLPAIYDYTMALFEGKPRPEDAPHFGELVVDLTLSEPDYELGVDKERISPLESVHEEIYFGTLHFFDVLGRYARGRPLDYPGRVIPIVRPKGDGRPGRARIRFTGFGASRPSVVMRFRERGGREGRLALDIPKVALERPAALAAYVRAGREGIERLDLRVKVDSEKDQREELIRRAREERVDEQVLSAEQVRAVVGYLERLRAAGLYRDALAYHHLGELRIAVNWEHEPAPGSFVVVRLDPNGAPAPWPDPSRLVPAGWRWTGGPIVQWDTPIPPGEAYELMAKMAQTFEEARMYRVGESYLGTDIWAMDLTAPVRASHWSYAKATTFKPTIIYSARQHANEVSSTSHTLKLAELLLTDPAFRAKLNKVNVVFHPITNPDGAQLAYELYKITPDYMLHAGYLGALGVDVTADQNDPDPIYPESPIRQRLWRRWLPDIFLNPHGYPSHEWVQIFSEYAAWVRNRVTESRDWWGMRGWFVPGFSYLDDPRYPRHKAAAFKIRDMFSRAVQAVPEVRALNERAYARYQRYGFAFDSRNFKVDFTNGVLIYTAIKGARARRAGEEAGGPSGGDFAVTHPNVTIWTGGTEAPDETAYGDWLKLVATAGLEWDKAILEYLVQGQHAIERREEAFWGGMSLGVHRPRPPRQQAAAQTTPEGR
jgi:hypothetical protein